MGKEPDKVRRLGSAEKDSKLIQALQAQAPAIKPPTEQEMVEALQQAGYRIIKEDPVLARQQAVKFRSLGTQRWEGGKTLRFGAVSDTHIGSRHQQLTFLNTFYDRCVERGIDSVFHAGDLFDGNGRVYRGQEYDLFLFGYDKQLDYGVEHYPKRDGVTTYVIAGNHDWSFYKSQGADILAALAERRPDIKYLGPMGAKVEPDGLKVQITHGRGGSTYARSYRIQRLIENFTPEQKPEVFLLGNFHNWAPVPMVRNVIGWQMGCFQSQTDHEKALGLFPEIGGLILEIDYGSKGADRPKGIVAFRDEIIPFYVPKESDY